jgi:hypothetical protein
VRNALTGKATAAAVLLGILIGGAWFLSQPQVPRGQPALLTLDAASVGTLRDAFNRDVAHVRIIVLPSPT